MKKQWIASFVLAYSLSVAAMAQQPTQTTSRGTSSPSTQRNTSSREGLDRKGGKDVGTRGSQKMKDGVSRSGNSNLSPTSPTTAPPTGGDKPGTSAGGGGQTGGAGTNLKEPTTKAVGQNPKPKGSGTRNGNTGSANITPMQTQGSTSEGNASAASAGGAPGTNTRVTRSVRPKSRATALNAQAKQAQPSAAGQATTARKTGSNGVASQGSSNVSVTERGQREGSYTDAAKRNKTAEGPSKDPLKTGPNGQQTKPGKQ